ncbi:DUF2809 domain-containing protein [Thalassotalea mangrovi]|uniref:DUF2809 domain-containing protein n=1 Tax=Thalassotalea mangrovi TaxID=2572245 RepID=A0A4U1B351_9GAMM|nr:DUF2809 domain-containing protein [Thalassotalea mangrovi]TKB43724.1 DUF2809 domain-containing protein [Thalassotalea mangrovi]
MMLSNTRMTYAVFALLTLTSGLLSRSHFFEFPTFVTLYVGDALWALLVFWLISLFFPANKNTAAATMALIFAISIEVSQLYQQDWINSLRQTTFGALVLGFGFKWSDIVAYVIGITLGFLLRCFIEKRGNDLRE